MKTEEKREKTRERILLAANGPVAEEIVKKILYGPNIEKMPVIKNKAS